MLGTNVHTTVLEYCNLAGFNNVWTVSTHPCLNVGVWSDSNFEHHCLHTIAVWSDFNVGHQRWYNVVTTVGQRCRNIVTMLKCWWKYYVGTLLPQHCLDIHTMLLAHLKAPTNEPCTTFEPTLTKTKCLFWYKYVDYKIHAVIFKTVAWLATTEPQF